MTAGCSVDFAVNTEGDVVIHKVGARPSRKRDRFYAARGKADVKWRTDDLMARPIAGIRRKGLNVRSTAIAVNRGRAIISRFLSRSGFSGASVPPAIFPTFSGNLLAI